MREGEGNGSVRSAGYGRAAHLEVGEGDGDRADGRRRRWRLLHGDGAAPDQAGRSCSCSAAGGWRSPGGSRPHGTVHLSNLSPSPVAVSASDGSWVARGRGGFVVGARGGGWGSKKFGAYLYQITVSGGVCAVCVASAASIIGRYRIDFI
jgi:hypothetical protein